MSTNLQGEFPPISSALGNLRQLFEQVLPTNEDTLDPDVFERLSRAAAEIAELERDRRRRRRERALSISRQVSELFPEMGETSAAFEQFGDEALNRAAVAVESAIGANHRLKEADSRLRAAVDKRDYGSAQDYAGRAREHQAAIAAQREVIGSLLTPLPDDDTKTASAGNESASARGHRRNPVVN